MQSNIKMHTKNNLKLCKNTKMFYNIYKYLDNVWSGDIIKIKKGGIK